MKTRNKPDKIDLPSNRSNIVTNTPHHTDQYKCKMTFKCLPPPGLLVLVCEGDGVQE